MTRHIVAWNHQEQFSQEERAQHAREIKAGLEALTQCIDGIIELRVHVVSPSGTHDLSLNSLFESSEALAAYRIHPEHKKVQKIVHAAMCNRVCIDYEE